MELARYRAAARAQAYAELQEMSKAMVEEKVC
jgi:hypothetical protein